MLQKKSLFRDNFFLFTTKYFVAKKVTFSIKLSLINFLATTFYLYNAKIH